LFYLVQVNYLFKTAQSFDQQKLEYNYHQWVRTLDRVFIYNWVELDDAVFMIRCLKALFLEIIILNWIIGKSYILCSQLRIINYISSKAI
jgi:hypothetical protein